MSSESNRFFADWTICSLLLVSLTLFFGTIFGQKCACNHDERSTCTNLFVPIWNL